MNNTQLGFIKRAQEYGYTVEQSIRLMKLAGNVPLYNEAPKPAPTPASRAARTAQNDEVIKAKQEERRQRNGQVRPGVVVPVPTQTALPAKTPVVAGNP